MTKETKRLIIIDGHAIVHRAYHALPPLTTRKGELVNAVYGFLLVFFKALKELRPDFIAATFDLPAPTFRHEKFKDYKATRPKAPDELFNQIPKIKEILKSFNVQIFEKEGYEADDIIGTISGLASEKQVSPKIETIIISGDLDVLQLIDSQTKVYALRRGVKDTILYDEEKVKERYEGLTPDKLVDLKALKGDLSDNIPGVPGVGEKTAIKLVKEFGNLENLYQFIEKADTLSESILKEKGASLTSRFLTLLKGYKEQVFFSKMLSQIKKDVPLDFNLEKCEWKGYDEGRVIGNLKKLEFYSLIRRLTENSVKENSGG